MTTNTNPSPSATIDHTTCGHPLTKQARAICRKARRTVAAPPAPRVVPEACSCKGKPSGFRDNGQGMWVCADCDRPTRMYLLNALGLALTA
jgi:hypothetical protein